MAILMMISMGLIVGSDQFGLTEVASPVAAGEDYSNTRELGYALYTDYLYPFEIAGAILLVAIIAAITLTMRKPRTHKTPRPEKQVSVRREDRVRLVNLKTEND